MLLLVHMKIVSKIEDCTRRGPRRNFFLSFFLFFFLKKKKKRGKESDEDEEIWSISNLVFGVAMDGWMGGLRLGDKPRCTISQVKSGNVPRGREGQSLPDASRPCAS